jgi:signal transduction histidine kinase/ActR/RegA family two-component response regulator
MAETELRYLQESLVGYRTDARGRVVTFVVVAACFMPLVGWPVALAWLASAFSSFLVGSWLERRTWSERQGRQQAFWIAAYLAGNVFVIGAIAVAAALKSGFWGVLAGEFLLFCFAVLITASARRSAVAFYAAMTALAIYMAAMGIYSFTLASSPAGPIVISLGVPFLLFHTHYAAASNRRLARESEAARLSAEAATAAKSAFVAMVSHELRTPLSGILAGAVGMQADARDATSRNNADLVIQSAQMMRTLLNDLLDLSKIEAGRMDVETVGYDLRRTIADTVRFWLPEVRRKHLRLRLEGAHGLPQWVLGDPTRLRQILNNLFSNALKFTDHGRLVLRMAIHRDGDGERLCLELEDTGPGMSEAQLGRLFTAFEQLGAATARSHGGTGLGLHISREFARLMGGDLSASSTLDVGSTFRLNLTLQRTGAPVAEDAPDALTSLGLRLLIVDDHEVNRRAFSLLLAPVASHIVTAEDGAQALAALEIQAFDVVLMDIHMPGLSGADTTRELRKIRGPNQLTPVIALTGAASAAQGDDYRAAGMNALVQKPAEAAELYAAIEGVLDQTAGGDPRAAAATADA